MNKTTAEQAARDLGVSFSRVMAVLFPSHFAPRYEWKCPCCGAEQWTISESYNPTVEEVAEIVVAPFCGGNRCTNTDGDETGEPMQLGLGVVP